MPKPISEEDFEKKWVTAYQPPGGMLENVSNVGNESDAATAQKSGQDITSNKRKESILKGSSEARRSVIRQISVSKSTSEKLDEKMRRQSSESSTKRTSFYIPATPTPTATEQEKSKGISAETANRFGSFDENSEILLQPPEMDNQQSRRLIKNYE